MQSSILTRNRRRLAHGAAILLLAGMSAGCSSDLMRFDHGLSSNNSSYQQPAYAQQQPVPAYQEQQAYPGDYASAQPDYLDQTTTASINSAQGQRQGLLRSAIRPDRRGPVPSVNVGANAAAPRQPFPQQPAPVHSASAQQLPAPVTPGVSRQPLAAPDPVQLDRTATGSIQPHTPAVSTSVPRQAVPATAAKLPADVPLPTRVPDRRVAVLPKPVSVPEPQVPSQKSARSVTTGSVYQVAAGDTLSAIARKTGTTADAIKHANRLDSALIRVGQKLVIPGTTVQANVASSVPAGVDPMVTGGVTKPATGYVAPKPKKQAEIDTMVERAAAAPDSTGVGRLRWPVNGRVIAAFGSQSGGKHNDGIDIAVPEGTPVKAAENGVVIYAGDGLKDFGNTVLVRHENGLVTVYGHNSKITVSRGTTVRRGQEIARSGLSGNADAPKLHFEVRKDSAPVDPATYLE
ncbi:MAG: peptidoglycan DD-metalloendopeptidase family protein [Rhizobiaceae bacterium]|nr:peptidoglycan DD-metalloendopeptidase family protein [Rhizobiaceae bacterium]